MDIARIIDELGLEPHPEGGYYVETWRHDGSPRGAGTAIYFLLTQDRRSHWHRFDAAEIWHFYAGDPVELCVADESGSEYSAVILGPDIAGGQRPQRVVPAHRWQSASTTGQASLVGCTASPAFEFAGFEMAPTDFAPIRR